MWYDRLIAKERQAHLEFFNKEFDLSKFQATLTRLGQQQIEAWQKLLLEPHYLPRIKMDRNATFPGWQIRPTDHHYEVVYQGKIFRLIDDQFQIDKKAHYLLGETALIDTRLKPAYRDGKQMYKNDYLGSIISKLRQDQKISQYGDQSSRFGVSSEEWQDSIRPILLADPRFSQVKSWRLERSIEAHTIPQIYLCMPRKDNGQTNTWQLYEEYFGGRSSRVYGGSSGYGGLAGFGWFWTGNHWGRQSFCPLAVL